MATIVTRLLPFWEARNVKKGVEEAGMMSTESLLNNFLSVFRYFPLKTQFLALILRLTMRYLKYFLYI
ncbi:BnaAnng21600D [Brassica napus]|uniref:BnaAnng21600D protein n=1 Tax=Brassica napus TaxID=3708 RepID=A0A078JL77_BRANA|nr:BnaAnng21600D [Brassica napus]